MNNNNNNNNNTNHEEAHDKGTHHPSSCPMGYFPVTMKPPGIRPTISTPPPPPPTGIAAAASASLKTDPTPLTEPLVAGGRFKALMVGINYRGTSSELCGCVNDVVHLMQFLKHGGLQQDIDFRVLADTGYNGSWEPIEHCDGAPTRANILEGVQWLVEDVKAGDRLLFHYSGHGVRTPDTNGDEEDGMDEALVPLDHDRAGLIVDDDLRRLIDKLPVGVVLYTIMDCCHSGSMLDLRYSYPNAGNTLLDKRDHQHVNPAQSETMAQVIAISGCQDYQTSADAPLPPPEPRILRSQGALTNHLLQTMYDLAYEAQQGCTPSWEKVVGQTCDGLKKHRFTQRPLLTSGKPLNIASPCGFYEFAPGLLNKTQ